MLWLWTSAALAGVGLLYVLLRGGWLLLRGRLRTGSARVAPLAGAFMLFAPLPFFLNQSFLALGDLIIASGLLVLATRMLSLGTAYGLVRVWMRKRSTPHAASIAPPCSGWRSGRSCSLRGDAFFHAVAIAPAVPVCSLACLLRPS